MRVRGRQKSLSGGKLKLFIDVSLDVFNYIKVPPIYRKTKHTPSQTNTPKDNNPNLFNFVCEPTQDKPNQEQTQTLKGKS